MAAQNSIDAGEHCNSTARAKLTDHEAALLAELYKDCGSDYEKVAALMERR